MKKAFSALVIVACLCTACGRGRIIPEGKMQDILEEMFTVDQWVRENDGALAVSDTTWLYEPVFRKYGYSFKDYDASIRRYLKDPTGFAEMMEAVCKSLEDKVTELQLQVDHDSLIKKILESIGGYEPVDFKLKITPQDTTYELFGKVQLSSECAGDSLSHPVDSIERGELELKPNPEEMLLSDGSHDASLKRHEIISKKIDRQSKQSVIAIP